MDTIIKSIRFSKEEEKAINEYADFTNKSFSDVVKSAILEKLEDEYDIRIADKAYEDYERDLITYTHEEVLNELGL